MDSVYRFVPETVMAFSGWVEDESRRPIKGGTLVAYDMENNMVYDTTVESTGKFTIGVDDFRDGDRFFLQAMNTKGKPIEAKIHVDSNTYPPVVIPRRASIDNQSLLADAKVEFGSSSHRYQLPDVIVKARLKSEKAVPTNKFYSINYADKGILTPKYETVEDLYNLWIEELNDYITKLQAGDLISFKAQDAAYGCDWKKWARFANSLKLKIAARLYNNEPAKAMQLVEEAASNKAGLMTSTDDDFLFCKATVKSSGSEDYVYGTGTGILSPSASRSVMNFMLGAKDPRVRFIYTKNSFNSSVVQAFIDKGRYDDLPSEVKANVIRDKDGNFEKWGGMGEPWVRYTSVPIVLDAKASHAAGKLSDEMYEEYFNPGLRNEIKLDDDHVKDYSPFSYYSTEMRKGRDDFQLPTAMTQSANGKIDMNVLQDTEDNPLYSMYMTAGEVNLYLAEFACLKGSAIAGKTYQEWYYAGVRASVEEYDKLAKSNKIPYYYDEGNPGIYAYDKFEKTIALQKGEIDTMLATDNIKLTGTKSADLEKIYLQLMMHFSEQPDDQYVTARRSGYPKVGSKLLPFEKFDGIALSAIPRRFVVSEPTKDDIMRDIVMKAYEEEGFKTLGTNSQGVQYNGGNAPLNVERVWPDKNAPQWGTPKE